MNWSAIIQSAASTRFAKTGSCDPFLLAKGDLYALCRELGGVDPVEYEGQGFLRVQARVFVPELKMQILVDEWGGETGRECEPNTR
jgi:hypothetical protein